MFYKCIMTFNSSTNQSNLVARHRTGGYTEAFYQSGNLDFPTVRSRFQTLCQKRALLLPTGINIVGQEYLTVDPIGPAAAESRLFPGASGYACDVPQMSVQCRGFSDSSRNVSKLVIKGIPDAWVVEGELLLLPQNKTPFTNFFNLLRDGGFRFRGRDLSQPTIPVLSISSLGEVLLEENNIYNVGDFVRILRTKNALGVRGGGRFMVSGTTPPTGLTLHGWTKGACTGGTIRLDGVVYPPYAGAEIVQAVTRKVGRPFGGYRGRASKRR